VLLWVPRTKAICVPSGDQIGPDRWLDLLSIVECPGGRRVSRRCRSCPGLRAATETRLAGHQVRRLASWRARSCSRATPVSVRHRRERGATAPTLQWQQLQVLQRPVLPPRRDVSARSEREGRSRIPIPPSPPAVPPSHRRCAGNAAPAPCADTAGSTSRGPAGRREPSQSGASAAHAPPR